MRQGEGAMKTTRRQLIKGAAAAATATAALSDRSASPLPTPLGAGRDVRVPAQSENS
ncbi:twin-arginine translocation signal domain-containing protein [Sphingomonas sp. SKA58]|uniref:twin-arginine translocation signal domain-containing protein n=1 Tax=Sphingomonas sp. (strain SKA58) TaxID=314266 RepID=UPI000A03F18D